MVRFLRDESGAVTVDWVVLTAAIVGLGLAVMAVVSGGVENLSNDTARQLALIEVGQSPFTNMDNYDLGGFVHAIDDGLAENTFAAYSNTDDYTDQQVVDALTGYHDSLIGGSAAYSDTDVDQYAGVYAAADERGIDVSGYTNPDDFSEIYHQNNS